MSTKHTPGPWRAMDAGNRTMSILRGDELVAYVPQGWPKAEREANARLIAAAPDMLAALKKIEDTLSFFALEKSSDPLAALWAELESGTPSATSKRAYFKERTRNALYNFVVRKFERAARDGLTQKELARRMGKRPDDVNRLLASPGNWEIDTVAEFLLCIAGEELVPRSVPALIQEVERLSAALRKIDARYDEARAALPEKDAGKPTP